MGGLGESSRPVFCIMDRHFGKLHNFLDPPLSHLQNRNNSSPYTTEMSGVGDIMRVTSQAQ